MKLTIVGCSGSMPGPASTASCYLLEHDGYRVVVDLGHGSVGALQRHIALTDIDAIVFSHLHADHCIDLTALYVAHRYGPSHFAERIPVLGPPDTAERLAAAYGMRRRAAMTTAFDFRELRQPLPSGRSASVPSGWHIRSRRMALALRSTTRRWSTPATPARAARLTTSRVAPICCCAKHRFGTVTRIPAICTSPDARRAKWHVARASGSW